MAVFVYDLPTQYYEPPPPPDGDTLAPVVFVEGTPSVAPLALPAGAARYHGGFYCQKVGVYNVSEYLPGVRFDPQAKALTYDGTGLEHNSYLGTPYYENPNTSYFAGVERGPFNPRWSDPVNIPLPAPIAGQVQCVGINSKHTRVKYWPYDERLHFFGGDYSMAGYGWDTAQDGRMSLWHLDPRSGAWGLDYPIHGRAGEYQPLSPDIMGHTWDKDREIAWFTYGDARPGIHNNTEWQTLYGGLSTANPTTYTDGTHLPVYTFDPKLANPKYTKHPVLPWEGLVSVKAREHAYDHATKRLYKMFPGFTGTFRLYWCDTTDYPDWPSGMTWSTVDINLAAGGSGNLIGDGNHRYAVGYQESPMHVDDVGRLLYFVASGYANNDTYQPAVLAVTLNGHPLGEHKVIKVCDLPDMTNMAKAQMGLLGCASMPFVWIEEYRKLVMFTEPLWQEVGPQTFSYEIDVDTGSVSQGPRFPFRKDGQRAWYPNAAAWYPPTSELIAWGLYMDASLAFDMALPTDYVRWHYNPDTPMPANLPVNPWTWYAIESVTMLTNGSATVSVNATLPAPTASCAVTADSGITPGTNAIDNAVGTNKLSDVDPDPARAQKYAGNMGQAGMLSTSGAAFSPECGALGSLIVTGGGHLDYGGNEVYRFDFASLTWSRINNPGPVNLSVAESTAQRTEMAGDYVYGELPDGSCIASHAYDSVKCIPGGSIGLLLRHSLLAQSWNGGICAPWSHVIDLATGVTTRYSLNAQAKATSAQTTAHTTCYDTVRNRVWGMYRGGYHTSFNYLDLVTRMHVQLTIPSVDMGYNPCSCQHPVNDLMLMTTGIGGYGVAHTWRLCAVDLANPTGGVHVLTTTGDKPPELQTTPAYSIDWNTDDDYGIAIAANSTYDGTSSGDNAHVYKIEKPTGDLLTGTWTVTRITLPEALPTNNTDGGYSRWRYIPSIRKFVYVSKTTNYVTLYTP